MTSYSSPYWSAPHVSVLHTCLCSHPLHFCTFVHDNISICHHRTRSVVPRLRYAVSIAEYQNECPHPCLALR